MVVSNRSQQGSISIDQASLSCSFQQQSPEQGDADTTKLAYPLRNYQHRLVEEIDARWNFAYRRVMLQLATGGGKTIVFSTIIRKFLRFAPSAALVLAHREELVTQAADKLAAITSDAPIGIVKAGIQPNYEAPIQVASVQSLIHRLHRIPHPRLVVIDEAHHSTAPTYRRILSNFPGAFQLGVTATPIRRNGEGFNDLFDTLVCGPSVQELIDTGHLSDFKLYADAKPMSTKGVKTRQGDYSTGDLAAANDVVQLSGNLIDAYRDRCPGKRCIVFAVNVEHSRIIAERYNAAGIRATHLDGDTPNEVRRQALAQFAAGQIKVLTNCLLFTEGFDLPALDAVQIARPTKSLSLWLQMIGRALRPADGKDFAILLDHTRNWAIHGLPTRKHQWSLEGVEIEPQELIVLPDGTVGEPQTAIVEESDKELVEVEVGPLSTWEDIWEKLVWVQRSRGYKPGWLMYQLEPLGPPLDIWQLCGDYLGRQPGWAWYRWKECSEGQENSDPMLPEILEAIGYSLKPELRVPSCKNNTYCDVDSFENYGHPEDFEQGIITEQVWYDVIRQLQPKSVRNFYRARTEVDWFDGFSVGLIVKDSTPLAEVERHTQLLEKAFQIVMGHPVAITYQQALARRTGTLLEMIGHL